MFARQHLVQGSMRQAQGPFMHCCGAVSLDIEYANTRANQRCSPGIPAAPTRRCAALPRNALQARQVGGQHLGITPQPWLRLCQAL
jgi:hypothetical protein